MRCRPFKLIDAMVMVAAAAIWMTLTLPLLSQSQMVWIDGGRAHSWRAYVGVVHGDLSIGLWVLTGSYLVMRLIPPRPLRTNLIRQPGMLYLSLMLALLTILMILSAFVSLVPWTNVVIALAFGLSWHAACRYHRSCAELGWIERLGRSLAVSSIIATAWVYPLYLLIKR